MDASWDDEVSRTIIRSLTLTSDIVSRNRIESGAYLLYSLRWEFHIWRVNVSIDDEVSHIIFGSL